MITSTIEQIVIDSYKRIGVVRIHDLTLETLSRRLKIYVDWTERPTTSYNSGLFWGIRINKYEPSFIQRWGFFHELGHLFLDGFDQRLAVRSMAKFIEMRANRFALHASMPIHLVRQMSHITPYKLAHAFNVPLWAAERRMLQIESKIILEGAI